jgi:hypothetical protein
VLAHAGLATVDMCFTATFVWALYCFTLWLERLNLRMSLAFGVVKSETEDMLKIFTADLYSLEQLC